MLQQVYAFSQTELTREQYIEKFADLAIIEMHRSGVPASITLAQGILESNAGQSRLSLEANNHFGIKCKGDWTGNTIYADDDAPDECFRSYASAYESFRDHSEFLRKNWRYRELFYLPKGDYENWAKGLQKAGYATNNQYAKLLIKLIEKYNLHLYDEKPLPLQQREIEVNNKPAVVVAQGETLEDIAKEKNISVKKIRRINDIEEGKEVKSGDLVYLKPKRRKASDAFHTVLPGETMWDISQKYGIKIKHLYKKNRMEREAEAAAGEKLYLRKKRSKDETVETVKPKEKEKFINPYQITIDTIDFTKPGPQVDSANRPDFYLVQKGDNIYRIAEKFQVFEEDLLLWNDGLNPIKLGLGQKIWLKPKETENQDQNIEKQQESENTKKHIVKSGETLYSISKKYNVSVEKIKEVNNMAGNSIQVGQLLILP